MTTSLRFISNLPFGLPWWVGLVMAVIVAICSWLYYNRERDDLPPRLRWFLPLLRSLAFLLGVLVLTGPILQTRTTIGELGRVHVYLDLSGSMTMQDRHMTLGRKLLVAEQLGWLAPGRIESTLLKFADSLADARHQLESAVEAALPQGSVAADESADASPEGADVETPVADVAALQQARSAFGEALQGVADGVTQELAERVNSELAGPLQQPELTDGEDPAVVLTALQNLAGACRSIEQAARAEFEAAVAEMVASGDESIETALSLFDETPRWRRAEQGLCESSARILTTLQQTHEVEMFILSGDEASKQQLSLDSETEASNGILAQAKGAESGSVLPFAGVTDLSSGVIASQKGLAVSDDADVSLGQPQTAIVLVTDGQHNSGPSPLQTARVLGSQGMPLYCLSVGASDEAQDLAVTGLEYPDLVFQKDRVRGEMIIRDRMTAGQPFVAEIRYEDEVLWQEQLLTLDVPERRVEFEFAIDELVERLGSQFESEIKQHTLPLSFEASIVPLAEESETTNNVRDIRLAAITEGYRLLILDGRSRWETRYLRNVFERDDQWTVDTIIAGPGTDSLEVPRGEESGQFPTERDRLFRYDMIIYGELPADLLTDHEFEWLREFVEIRGGGIVFIDGQRGRLLDLTEQSLATLLPIEWLPGALSAKPSALQLSEKGAAQPFLKLKPEDQANRRFWSQLPPPHNLVMVNALPGAEVLVEAVESGTPRPVMVRRNYGAGRVLYLATDETWRWRYKTADEWHQRIWNQIAKYAMPRPFAASDDFVSVDTGSVSYDYGDAVDIRVRLLDLEGRPSSESEADAVIWKNGRIVSTVNLQPDPEVPGIYRGRSGGLAQGEYEVSVRASGYSESALKARSRFVVLPPESGEMATTSANEPLLRQMAEASGGKFLREEEIGKLPELLAHLSHGRVVESDPIPIWKSYWWFAAIIVLLTMEWILRKRAGML